MIIDCLSKAIFLFVIYNIVALMLFGVPKSLSMTYYLFRDREKMLRGLFPAFISLLYILLMPCWLQLSQDSTFQFTSFLSIGSLFFVGMSPAFNDYSIEHLVHNISAYSCAAFAILWIVLVTPYWYVILMVAGVIGVIGCITKTWKTSYIYWLEMIAMISTFITMIMYYISLK